MLEGATVVFSTQNLEEIGLYASRVLVLQRGRLAFDGAVAEYEKLVVEFNLTPMDATKTINTQQRRMRRIVAKELGLPQEAAETEEALNVAGPFTIDGRSAAFVDGIDGDASNVVGLSLPLFRRMLSQLGVEMTSLWC